MADDYLFYDEDYDDDMSDWDEGSASNDETKDDNDNKPDTKNNGISEQKIDPDPDKESKLVSPPINNSNGTTALPSTPNKTLLSTSNNTKDIMVSRSPTALSIPYIPKSTASSFILHKYSVFTTKVCL